MAEIADIRDKMTDTGEETKESIIREAVDEYPKSEDVLAKVSVSIKQITFGIIISISSSGTTQSLCMTV